MSALVVWDMIANKPLYFYPSFPQAKKQNMNGASDSYMSALSVGLTTQIKSLAAYMRHTVSIILLSISTRIMSEGLCYKQVKLTEKNMESLF